MLSSSDVFGIANYYLPVFGTEKEVAGEIPAAILWILSVQDTSCEGSSGDGCVTKSQVKWFVDTSKALAAKYGVVSSRRCLASAWLTFLLPQSKPIFSMLFFHIPTPEWVDLWNNATVLGNKTENVCCPRVCQFRFCLSHDMQLIPIPKVNTGLYEAAYGQSVSAMFVGHDHKNDYCGAFAGKPSLSLCYGRKTGYGYYQPM